MRGRGLFLGVELKQPPEGLVQRALERGLIINVTAKNDAPTLSPPTAAGTAPSASNPNVARVNEGAGNTVTLTALMVSARSSSAS